MNRMIPDYDRLGDFVTHWSQATPEAEAWIFEETTATYAGLAKQVDAVAKSLIAAGINRGDRVAMLSTPRSEFWQVFLATVSIGAVWVGLNPRYQVGEMEHVITDSEPRLLIALASTGGRSFTADIAELAERTGLDNVVHFGGGESGWNEFLDSGKSISEEQLTAAKAAVVPADPALIVYTSGSTGKPKGAVLGHRGLCECFRIQAGRQTATSIRVIANLPVNHIGGVGDLCCTPFIGGGTIIFQEQFSPDDMFDAIENHGVTALMQVPTTLKMLSEHPRFSTTDLSSVQAVHWGGGPLPAHVLRHYRRVAKDLGTTYGMTEITGSVTYSDDDASDEVLANTVGRPIPEIDIRIVDADGNDVGIGGEGEVIVRHPGQMIGYFRNPEQTSAAVDDDGFFHTGDVAMRRDDGNLVLVGRMKEMFKSGGYNVYPREVELAIEAHVSVRSAAVVAVPDEKFEEVGYAFVECDEGSTLDADELRVWCHSHLANYKVPKAFEMTSALPLLPVGKVDKKSLAAQARANVDAQVTES